MTGPPLISIVAPCFNEEACLAEFHRELSTVLDALPYRFEVIYVDDGSCDGTLRIARRLRERDPRVKTIAFSRNFGHQAALLAGLDAASGVAVVTLDSDLQHPPALIPKLIEEWENGNDIVFTVRRDTADAGMWKRLTSRLFYWLINRVSAIDITPAAADFRLMGREPVEAFRQLREYHRFNRGLVDWLGFRTATVEFDAPARFAGESKYSTVKMFRFALNAIVSFSVFPLRVAVFLGFVMSSLAMLYAAYALYIFFFTDRAVQGWTSTLVTTLLIGGIQLICLGMVGEYVGKTFEEVKRRPIYVIRRREGFEEE